MARSGAPLPPFMMDLYYERAPWFPFLQVQYPNDLWWTVPAIESEKLFRQSLLSYEGEYEYRGWAHGRVSQYRVDFAEMKQTNKNDKNSVRTVDWVWRQLAPQIE